MELARPGFHWVWSFVNEVSLSASSATGVSDDRRLAIDWQPVSRVGASSQGMPLALRTQGLVGCEASGLGNSPARRAREVRLVRRLVNQASSAERLAASKGLFASRRY